MHRCGYPGICFTPFKEKIGLTTIHFVRSSLTPCTETGHFCIKNELTHRTHITTSLYIIVSHSGMALVAGGISCSGTILKLLSEICLGTKVFQSLISWG